jgi:hypothetical protein
MVRRLKKSDFLEKSDFLSFRRFAAECLLGRGATATINFAQVWFYAAIPVGIDHNK